MDKDYGNKGNEIKWEFGIKVYSSVVVPTLSTYLS